jgi:hypothetical protein
MVDKTFTTFVPFGKLDDQPDGTLLVWGRATEEVRDSANEIMDYKSSAPLFQSRTQENFQRSDGQNLMPLRSMHQNIAAGKVVQFDYKDGEKAIDICAHVVDENEVKKVKNHVYTGFSVGGKYARRWPDGGSMRYTADPREISLVDTPAVPTARLTLFKIDGVPEDEPEWVADFKQAVEDMKKIKQAEQEEKDLLLLKRKTIGESIGIAYREDSPLNAPNNSSTPITEYGDPANFAFPVYKESMCKLSIDHFNNAEGLEKYSLQERPVLGRRLAVLAKRFDGGYVYDPVSILVKKETNMSELDLTKLDVGAIVAGLKSQASSSASLASTDPNAALTALMGYIDSLPVGNPISGQNVPVQDPSVSLGKGELPPALAAANAKKKEEATPAEKNPPAPKGKKVEPAEPEEEDSAEEPDGDEVYKNVMTAVDEKLAPIADALNKLTEALTKRVAQPTTSTESPVGALNSLVKGKSNDLPSLDETEREIIRILDEGSPYALIKCLEVAGASDSAGGNGALAWQIYNNAIRKASYDDLEKGGVVTASRYAGRLY